MAPKQLVSLALLSVAAACSSALQRHDQEMEELGPLRQPPTQAELASADYGLPPTDYENVIRDQMLVLLKDPDSARFRFGTPKKGWAPIFLIDSDRKLASTAAPGLGHFDRTKVIGWELHFTVNAKNSYGGYAGPSAYRAFFYRGNLAAVLQAEGMRDRWDHPMETAVLAWPAAVASVPRVAPATPSR